MKRFGKILGSVVLATALTIGSVGAAPVQTPALAADAKTTPVNLTDLAQMLGVVKDAVEKVAVEKTIQADTSIKINADLGVLGKKTTELKLTTKTSKKLGIIETDVPVIKDVMDLFGAATIKTDKQYGDVNSNLLYYKDPETSKYEKKELPANLAQGITDVLLSPATLTEFAQNITAEQAADATVSKKKCKVYNISIKLDAATIQAKADAVKQLIGGLVSDELLSKIAISEVNLTITPYIDSSTQLIVQTGVKGSITVNYSGLSVPLVLDGTIKNKVTDEALKIPDEYLNNAQDAQNTQIAAGYKVSKNGLKLVAEKSGSTMIFCVTGVTKTGAKKLTVPGSVSVKGQSYKVTKAKAKAFKKAKKLKTLVVKNAALKKEIKNHKKKYGLKKSVKVKA